MSPHKYGEGLKKLGLAMLADGNRDPLHDDAVGRDGLDEVEVDEEGVVHAEEAFVRQARFDVFKWLAAAERFLFFSGNVDDGLFLRDSMNAMDRRST